MKRECIKIGKPEVITEGDKSILRAEIDDAGVKKILDYRVDAKWGKYLTWERSDSFLLSVLYYAMVKDKDVVWEIPCSEQLIYQLQTYYIPVAADEMAFMHKIDLSGPTTTELLPCENGVATGLSNGVDSCYTVHKHLSCKYPEYDLTHVIFTDWYTTFYDDDYREDFLNNYLNTLPKCAEELGLEFIFVEYHPDIQFSIGLFQDEKCGTMVDHGFGAFKFCSVPMALQKLIHIYYFSSGFAPADMTFQADDMAYHDVFTVPLISTPALTFYSAGMEAKIRVDKVAAIVDWPYAQKHLQICGNRFDANCGYCRKCQYTLGTLYAMGKLDSFASVFPVEDFKSHLSQRFAYILARAKRGHVHSYEVIDWMKKNNVQVPAMSYVLCPFYMLLEASRKHFHDKPWARKLARKLHIDRALHRNMKFNSSKQIDDLMLEASRAAKGNNKE